MSANSDCPTCWIIAGPNGAGKTTFALSYLPDVAECRRFINADSIAAGLSPLAPEQAQAAASRMYLARIGQYVSEGQDFGFETTLSGRGYLRLISRLQHDNWRVELVYLALPSVEMSKWRVAERVAHGGHDIPQEAIERHFARSLRNFSVTMRRWLTEHVAFSTAGNNRSRFLCNKAATARYWTTQFMPIYNVRPSHETAC